METFGYYDLVLENLKKINETQNENIDKATDLMVEAIKNDRLISVFGGGGHTTLPVGEMFFRAGGLSNINPIMETGLSVFNQALKYLELERTPYYGASILKYYDLQKDDVLIIFHNIGINPATIDCAIEAKNRGVKIIAIASEEWQSTMPKDHFIRHSSGQNLFDLADVCINDYNHVGDATIKLDGFDTPMGPISNIVHFYIAHILELNCANKCLRQGIEPPVWSSANIPGGDQKNKRYLDKYKSRIKML